MWRLGIHRAAPPPAEDATVLVLKGAFGPPAMFKISASAILLCLEGEVGDKGG